MCRKSRCGCRARSACCSRSRICGGSNGGTLHLGKGGLPCQPLSGRPAEASPSSANLSQEVRMRNFAIAAVAVLAIAGSTAVYAQHRHWGGPGFSRMNPEDRPAYADARIAAVHAGLKLTADQEKLWPPVEAAVKEFAKLRIDPANERTKAQGNASAQQTPGDPV